MMFVKWMDKVNRALTLCIGIILGIMTVVVFMQVVVRFVLPKLGIYASVPWTEELARFLMIWCVFIGAGVATRYSKLLSVDLLTVALPALFGRCIKIVSHVLSISFFVWFLIIAAKWSAFGFTESAPVMGIPMTYVYWALVVGPVLMTLNTAALLIDSWVNHKDILEVNEG